MAESSSKEYFSKNNFQACHNRQVSTSRLSVFCFVFFSLPNMPNSIFKFDHCYWIFIRRFQSLNCCKFVLQFSHNMIASQLLKDPEASSSVFSCACCFVVVAAAPRVKAARIVVQPGSVASKWIFERHNIAVLYRGSVASVPGKNLEGGMAIV